MTKEPIIIDDVDVSGCEFYNKVIGEDAYCNIDEEHLCTCISYENCYYKQLKRKEQECEEWKNKYYSSTTEVKADLIKQLDQLKEENEQLKKSVRSNKDKRKRAVERYLKLKEFTNKEFNKLKAENEELQEKIKAYDEVYSNHDVLNERNNYKQALQEIKDYCNKYPQNSIGFKKQILQKCEVIG